MTFMRALVDNNRAASQRLLTDAPGVFIFTGHGAGHIGYQDVFEADGSFRYTRQGQLGDMRMISGNRAIRDHVQNSKDLLLF